MCLFTAVTAAMGAERFGYELEGVLRQARVVKESPKRSRCVHACLYTDLYTYVNVACSLSLSLSLSSLCDCVRA